MFGNLSGPTLLVILFIVLLLFGAPKLPALARSLGQSMRILKKEVSSDESKAEDSSTPSPAEGSGTANNDAQTTDAPTKRQGEDTPPSSGAA